MARTDRQPPQSTLAEMLAMAEAWHERAAVLAAVGFELSELFGAPWSPGAPVYLVRRLAGGASPADPHHVEELRAEIFAAAERAREKARALLAAATKPATNTKTSSLDGTDRVVPRVDYGAIRVREAGDDIEPNPAHGPVTERTPARIDRVSTAPDDVEGGTGPSKNDLDAAVQGGSVTPLRPRRSKR